MRLLPAHAAPAGTANTDCCASHQRYHLLIRSHTMTHALFPLMTGSCTLVGVGPGDPELLTLKALKAIHCATVLLVDDLVAPAVVALASPHARIIDVGKRGGCKSTPQ